MSGTEARRVVVGCVAAVIALSGSAYARASELTVAGQSQLPDVPYSLTVTRTPGGSCDLDILDGFWEFPTPLTLAPGAQEARVLYRRRVRPAHVKVTASRRVDEQSKPSGPREVLDTTLIRAHPSGGAPAGWQATFMLKPPQFLTVATDWPSDRGCGIGSQSLETYSVARG